MALIFKKGMQNTINTYEKWWNKELDRGLIPVVLCNGDTDKTAPIIPGHKPGTFGCTQAMFADLSVTPKQIIDSCDYALSRQEHLGDAYPFVNMDFSGPGIGAVYMGAHLEVSEGNIWFFGPNVKDIRDIQVSYDPNNIWLERSKEIIREGTKRWGDDVLIGTPDIGGGIDILASFRGTHQLLLDLYDNPEEVSRLVKEIGDLWQIYFDELTALTNKGKLYTNWAAILSTKSSQMLQADFAYMISTEMFDEFVRPELAERCAALERACFHLDGPGQIPHLDSLLSIDGMSLIQWIPGAGTTPVNRWTGLYEKVLNSGKHLQVQDDSPLSSREDQLDGIVERRGSLKNVVSMSHIYDCKDKDEALRLLDKYGVEA